MKQNGRAPVAIIGGGLAGLTAARFLSVHEIPFILFEGSKNLAGMARSFVDQSGFVYDSGAHFITNRLAAALGISSDCRKIVEYGESVLVGRKIRDYPFGLMRDPRFATHGIAAMLKKPFSSNHKYEDASAWFRSEYGRGLADAVALPLLEAWSGARAEELSSAVGSKLQHGALHTAYLRAWGKLTKRVISIGYSSEMPENPSVWHVYPQGGIGAICERLASDVRDRIRTESRVEKVFVENGRVFAVQVNGEMVPCGAVVSTAPAPALARIVSGSAILKDVAQFRFRPMISVNLHLAEQNVLPDTVVWVPRDSPVFRLTETTRSMPWLAPPGHSRIACDISDEINGKYWSASDEQLGQICLDSLRSLGFGRSLSLTGVRVSRIPLAYPLYLKSYETARLRFAAGTGISGLYSIGRNGEFRHLLMEDVYWRTLARMNQLVTEMQSSASSHR